MAIQDLQDYKGRSEDTGVSEQAQSNCGKLGYPVQGKGYAQYFTKEGRRSLANTSSDVKEVPNA